MPRVDERRLEIAYQIIAYQDAADERRRGRARGARLRPRMTTNEKSPEERAEAIARQLTRRDMMYDGWRRNPNLIRPEDIEYIPMSGRRKARERAKMRKQIRERVHAHVGSADDAVIDVRPEPERDASPEPPPLRVKNANPHAREDEALSLFAKLYEEMTASSARAELVKLDPDSEPLADASKVDLVRALAAARIRLG